MEAVLMILPRPRGSMCLASAWQQRKTPRVLRSKVRSQSARGVSSAAEFLLTPALFTAMSSAPHASTTRATMASMAAGSAQFALMAMARAPLDTSSAATASARPTSRSATATDAPASASACANARPMPWPPPVTRAAWPSSRRRSSTLFPATPRTTSSPSTTGARTAHCGDRFLGRGAGGATGGAGADDTGMEQRRSSARRMMVMPSRTGSMTCSTRGSSRTLALKAAMAAPPAFHSAVMPSDDGPMYGAPLKSVLSTTMQPPGARRPRSSTRS
mmetsp:Transcript_312/g.866  ORF Transcript_312/g.866 Transcript_312/m.866 type:complete len:274 (+) Transcript_312:94-915(+)